MNRKKTSPKKPTKKNQLEREPISRHYYFLTIICGLILIVGFFFAARQHFSSIDFGIKNSRLKKQIEEFESDKRRLLLAREIALSPGEIKKAAKKIGFTEMTASNIAVFRPGSISVEKSPMEKSSTANSQQMTENKTSEPAAAKKPEKVIIKTPAVKIEKENKPEKKQSNGLNP